MKRNNIIRLLSLIILTTMTLSSCDISLIPSGVGYSRRKIYTPRRSQMEMQQAQFQRLYSAVSTQTFTENKLNTLAAHCIPLYTKQGLSIMSLFSFDTGKLEALKIILPQIIDKNNIYHLIDGLSYYDAKNTGREIIQSYLDQGRRRNQYPNDGYDNSYNSPYRFRGNYGYRIMSDASFNRLVSAVKDATFSDASINVIKQALYNANLTGKQCFALVQLFTFDDDKLKALSIMAPKSIFTCGDCVRLMKLFTFDDKRLKVCRYVIPCIIDPQNSIDVISNLSFSNSRDRAAALFRKYSQRSYYQ